MIFLSMRSSPGTPNMRETVCRGVRSHDSTTAIGGIACGSRRSSSSKRRRSVWCRTTVAFSIDFRISGLSPVLIMTHFFSTIAGSATTREREIS